MLELDSRVEAFKEKEIVDNEIGLVNDGERVLDEEAVEDVVVDDVDDAKESGEEEEEKVRQFIKS